MINLVDIVSYLQDKTNFMVDFAHAVQPVYEYEGNPLVYVGYGTIRSSIADKLMDVNEYNVHGEGMVQIIETQLICDVATFYDNYKLLYHALNGWNPIVGESFRTALAYAEGGVIGLDNGIQRHLDRWRIGFSTGSDDF